ncbi:MAG: hypothetical protein DI535_23480 [Citrobacter freundii]|nr:MAG: hypothetical protein DI535_23480 [Citrobacter freundii]
MDRMSVVSAIQQRKILSNPSTNGFPDLLFSNAYMLAEFRNGNVVMFFFTKRFADTLQEELSRTLAKPREVFNVFGEDDDALPANSREWPRMNANTV